jgi:hypothetical protein
MKWYRISPMFITCMIYATWATAGSPTVEVAACLFSPAEMMRQPKAAPPVLAESTFNCGKQGESSLAHMYEGRWRLIHVLPNGTYANP